MTSTVLSTFPITVPGTVPITAPAAAAEGEYVFSLRRDADAAAAGTVVVVLVTKMPA